MRRRAKSFLVTLAVALLCTGRAETPSSSIAHGRSMRERLDECFTARAIGAPERIVVNGNALTPAQVDNVQWISRCVIPFLPDTWAHRTDLAAKVTWWALKEGNLDLPSASVIRYSNCHTRHGDRDFSDQPGFVCPTSIWQTGMSGIQVPVGDDAKVLNRAENLAHFIHPQATAQDLLHWTVSLADFSDSPQAKAAILNSTGRLRTSWLLRNPIVGFASLDLTDLGGSCFVRGREKSWCFGKRWDATKAYAPTQLAAGRAISDLRKYFRANVR